MVSSLKIILAFMYLITSTFSASAEVISLGNPKRILEFQRYLQTKPNLKSLNEVYLKNEFSKTEKILVSKYQLAVKGLLLEDLKPSTFVFKEIVSWQKKSFLNTTSAEILLQSHLRLAHLEQANSGFWLKNALFFDPDYSPKAGLFNPDLAAALEKQKKLQSPYLYLLSKMDIADENTLLFVNGTSILNSTKIHPSGQYRLTVLKEGFEKLELNFNGEDIAKLKPSKLKPLDLGTCKAPSFKKRYGIQIEKIFFSKDCIKSLQKVHSNTLAKRIESPLNNVGTVETAVYSKPRPLESRRNIFQKKTTWYIIGAAVATGILVSVLSNQNGETRVIPVAR